MELITTRRQFIGVAGTVAAGLGLAACSTGTTSTDKTEDETEDETESKEDEASVSSNAEVLVATSTLYGTADTANKSSLKKTLIKTGGPGDTNLYHYNEDGERVTYPVDTVLEMPGVAYTGEATFVLGEDLDVSLLDASNAVVGLAEGAGYYVDELILNNTTLDGDFEDGTATYTLSEGDLEWNMGDYPLVDENSGREWSVFGGDGNGCYTFNFQLSGVTYDGAEIDPVIFPVQVYIWGRDATDLMDEFNATPDPTGTASTSGLEPTDEIQWTWVGDGDKPILCDDKADDFFVVWPEGSDASGITSENVTVTLESEFGDILELEADTQFEVFSSETETQIAVTFMNWPYTPVYTKMSIAVEGGDLVAEETFDVASVFVYMVQQGGGGVTIDGTVTAYSYYGFDNLDDVFMILNKGTYTLTQTVEGESEDDEGTTYYFVESEDGTGTLTENGDEATTYDATGEDDLNEQLVAQTALVTTRVDQTVDKEVDGETVTLTKTYQSRVTKDAAAAIEAGLEPAPGFAIGDEITPHEAWAWQDRFLAGYTPDKPAPTSFPYTTFPYGF